MQENIIFILRIFSKYFKTIIEQYLETPEKNCSHVISTFLIDADNNGN